MSHHFRVQSINSPSIPQSILEKNLVTICDHGQSKIHPRVQKRRWPWPAFLVPGFTGQKAQSDAAVTGRCHGDMTSLDCWLAISALDITRHHQTGSWFGHVWTIFSHKLELPSHGAPRPRSARQAGFIRNITSSTWTYMLPAQLERKIHVER